MRIAAKIAMLLAALLVLVAANWTPSEREAAVADWEIGATDVSYCEVGPKSLKRGYGC